MEKSITFSRPVIFDCVAGAGVQQQRADRLWAALASGDTRVPPIERHSLEGAAEAHARLESRATSSALILLA